MSSVWDEDWSEDECVAVESGKLSSTVGGCVITINADTSTESQTTPGPSQAQRLPASPGKRSCVSLGNFAKKRRSMAGTPVLKPAVHEDIHTPIITGCSMESLVVYSNIQHHSLFEICVVQHANKYLVPLISSLYM